MSKEVLVIGKESAGKSQLIASLSGKAVYASNFRGSTVACEAFRARDYLLIDTPGIQRSADTEAMRTAMDRLKEADSVLLVAPAAHLEEDLQDLLPLVEGKRISVIVTFIDRIGEARRNSIQKFGAESGLPFVYLNARSLSTEDQDACHTVLGKPVAYTAKLKLPPIRTFGASRSQSATRKVSTFRKCAKGLLALVSLLLPGVGVVWFANDLAGRLDPLVRAALSPLAVRFNYPLLTGDYGLLTMGPLLFVWAVPVVILYALVLGAYKASGLVDVLSDALDPFLRPFGLSGRDLPRILMGFGCNVPAVIGTRSCSTSSRDTCISAIAFGSACSYQFGATLGVFNAVHKPGLVLPYLLYLGLTTLVYARLVTGRATRSPLNILMAEHRTRLVLPQPRAVWREAWGSIRSFFRTSLPIFFAITILASLLDLFGILKDLAMIFRPVMWLFGLPAQASLGVLMAAIRKDGLLLLSRTPMTTVQTLTAVYLAGVMFPCIVTLLTIGRERSWKFALRLLGRQVLAASCFSLVLAWLGRLF